MLYLQQLPALAECSVFMTGMKTVRLAQCPDPWGGKEATAMLGLSPDPPSLSGSHSMTILSSQNILQWLLKTRQVRRNRQRKDDVYSLFQS